MSRLTLSPARILGGFTLRPPVRGGFRVSLNDGPVQFVPFAGNAPAAVPAPSGLQGAPQSFTFALTEAVLPPENTVAPALTPTTPVEGTVLTCSTGTWLYLVNSFTYQWRRDGVDIMSETTNQYIWSVDDAEATITCQVTAHGLSNVTAVSNGLVQFTEAPAYAAIPALGGSGPWAYTGDTFTVPDPTPDGGGLWIFAFTWKYQGVSKALTVSNIYPTDAGHLAVFSPADPSADEVAAALLTFLGYGSYDSGTHTFTFDSQYPGDYNSVSGVPDAAHGTLTGPTLTATPGTLTGTPVPSVVNSWERCDVSGAFSSTIVGATGLTYQLTAADAGWRIRFKQVATNAIGSATTYSTPTAQVALTP